MDLACGKILSSPERLTFSPASSQIGCSTVAGLAGSADFKPFWWRRNKSHPRFLISGVAGATNASDRVSENIFAKSWSLVGVWGF